MKYLLFSAFIPGIIFSASQSSPMRSNHSKSAGEIPSLIGVTSASAALDIPKSKGHERKRSNSELEIQMANPWASPPSTAMSPTSWTSSAHTSRPPLQKQKSLGLVATHRPRRLTPEETLALKEQKWRKLRRNQFGPSHKRTGSLPTDAERSDLHNLMELSEQYGIMKQTLHNAARTQLEAMRVQSEFKDEAGKAGSLLSLMETSNFEELLKLTVKLSNDLKIEIAKRVETERREAAQREELRKQMLSQHLEHLTEVNQLVKHVTQLVGKIDHIMNLAASSNEPPTSPRSSSDKSRSSRSNSNSGSFLGLHFGSNH